MKASTLALNYDPATLSRELKEDYISTSEQDEQAMLQVLGKNKLDDLFEDIDAEYSLNGLNLPGRQDYYTLIAQISQIAAKNQPHSCFIGDSLLAYQPHPIVPEVSGIRKLTTSYTPYQPERSQGTLIAHWIFQCKITELTGMDVVNSSLYDRATAIVEAILASARAHRGSTVIISEGLHPNDLEVIETHLRDTAIEWHMCPLDKTSGQTSAATLKELFRTTEHVCSVVLPQVNQLGVIECIHELTDLAHVHEARMIGVVEPRQLAAEGLTMPKDWGKKGLDILVGEGQNLAIGPSFGGPGLGLFALQNRPEDQKLIRTMPGRIIGKAKDASGKACFTMVLAAREQHIRKDKATSNICSNQAFLATLAGAAIAAWGNEGLNKAQGVAIERANQFKAWVNGAEGINFAFEPSLMYQEITVKVDAELKALLARGRDQGLEIGLALEGRDPQGRDLLKVSFTDFPSEEAFERFMSFCQQAFTDTHETSTQVEAIDQKYRNTHTGNIKGSLSPASVLSYYEELGELNLSPDQGCYPLGSCTMKYNPYINDWAATLPHFADLHPQTDLSAAQGALEILYSIQEWFKAITGLAGVTTQPVAGAQGELTGIKMIQAYHHARGESERSLILVPTTAHGTNFATAVMAGYPAKDLVYLEALPNGKLDIPALNTIIEERGAKIAALMITNPNTSGLLETDLPEAAKLLHDAGALVYMDGANMNAIAGRLDLGKLGVDAVHQNLHKTWTIPHGGGGPGDAVVGVSERLLEFLPGYQIKYDEGQYTTYKTQHSIGSMHRNWGNFGHKVRAYAYIARLGKEGVPRFSGVAVMNARYLYSRLSEVTDTLPKEALNLPRKHEFIITPRDSDWELFKAADIPKSTVIPSIGKLFLDFGFHAPTVAFPEPLGLMIEPTESFTKQELDHFADCVAMIFKLVRAEPKCLLGAPFFTPVSRVNEVEANRSLVLNEPLETLPELPANSITQAELLDKGPEAIYQGILEEVKG